ncbi:MAG: FIST N-terminal domain-containing protein [Planctomycetota bacterium]
MRLETFAYDSRSGWSVAAFPPIDSQRTLIVVFAGSGFADAPDPIVQLSRAYPQAKMIGCSSSGEIFGTEISDDSLAVAVAAFDEVEVATVAARVASPDDSFAAGAQIASELADSSLHGVFVLSDGLCVNGSELVRGLNSALPESVVVTGGLAGDGDRFKRTWVLANRTPAPGMVTAAGLYGDSIAIGHGSKGGWDILGPERVVTRSHGNVLFELDGKPALALYREYLGERASGLPATGLLFPLAIRADDHDERHLVRTILAVDDADQSMVFAGDIPQGWRAQLMKANSERLIGGASDAAAMARTSDDGHGPRLGLAISCVGRRLVLGERSEEEIEATLEALPRGTQLIGFYSYGEISPFGSGWCDLHNQTMTLTTLGEL